MNDYEFGEFSAEPADMTDYEKVSNVEEQIHECMKGRTTFITCPWCKTEVTPADNALCCADLGITVRAILRRQAQSECLETAARIADAAMRN